MGNFLTSILSIAESIGTASSTVTKDLSKSNFIAGLAIRLKLTGTSPTATLTRLQIVGNNSSAIVDVSGAELQAYLRHANGTAAVGGADAAAVVDYYVPFNRFKGDVAALLSAKLFKTLQLKMQWTFGGTVTVSALDISQIEYVGDDDPYAKWQLRLTEVASKASAASGNVDFTMPAGSIHRHIMVNATGTDGTTVSEVVLRINNGTEIPIDQTWIQNQVMNAQTRTGLNAVVANFAFFDLDVDNSFQYALQSGGANDITLRTVNGASGQTIAVVLADAVQIPK